MRCGRVRRSGNENGYHYRHARLAVSVVVAAAAASAAGCSAPSSSTTRGGRIAVVAAENFWGNVAEQIGGSHVQVTSIISDPNADPHLFEAMLATPRRPRRRAS